MAEGLFRPAHEAEGGAPATDQASPGPMEKDTAPRPVPARSGLTRRAFLVRGSLAAGAAAIVGSIPGVGGILTTAEADSTEVEGGAAPAAGAGASLGPAMSQPIVAHVVDLDSGEINLYQGTTQVVVRNPGLAQAVARLAASRS